MLFEPLLLGMDPLLVVLVSDHLPLATTESSHFGWSLTGGLTVWFSLLINHSVSKVLCGDAPPRSLTAYTPFVLPLHPFYLV